MTRSLQPTILVVEDEESIASIIKYNLKKAGFMVVVIDSGDEALKFLQSNTPDLVLLDWMLPGMSGVDVCKAIRENPAITNLPIIMLSAKGEEIDKITGLERGADDYITKPFSPVELSARINAVLRRIRPAFSGKKIEFQDICVDFSTMSATRNGMELKLSPIEFKILQALIEKPGRVLSRDVLMDKIWGSDIYVGTRTIDVHITRLRKALVDSSKDGVDIIKTVRLGGYAIKLPKDEQN